jgi:GT2 family glycosyltransferase
MAHVHHFEDVKKMLQRVSIVVTAKNEEKNISELLDSIEKFVNVEETEVVVVDGGSTDKTVNVISQYPFVKLVTSQSNISKGRNLGVANSTGGIIVFTDADCVVDEDWIRNILRYFKMDSEIGVVGGPYIPFDQHGLIAKYLGMYVGTYFPADSGFVTHQCIGTGNAAYRRKAIEEAGGFDERLDIGEDIDLNLRINNLGYKLFFAKDVKVYHKYRTSLKEASRWAFNHGAASTTYNKITKEYRKLFFPYTRSLFIVFGAILVASIILRNLFLLGLNFGFLLFYYFYKLHRFRRKTYQAKMTLKTLFVMPIIDIYIRFLESFGSFFQLLKLYLKF